LQKNINHNKNFTKMKKFYKLIFTLLLIFYLASFGGCKKPIVQVSPLYNTTWATLLYGPAGSEHIYIAETQYDFFDGDSVFNGNTYKKLYCYKDEQHSTRFYEGLIRDDNSKVFIIPKDADMEYLLYDFSVTGGTTFEYTSYNVPHETLNVFVKQVDYVNINGNNIKRIQLTSPPPYDDNNVDTWYEGIGSINGFLNSVITLDGGYNILLCCYKNDTLLYHHSQFPDCYYDNPEEVENLLNSNNQTKDVSINFNEEQQVSISGSSINIKFTEVEDNRVPLSKCEMSYGSRANVKIILNGNTISLQILGCNTDNQGNILDNTEYIDTLGYRINTYRLEPYPSGTTINQSDYLLKLRISKL